MSTREVNGVDKLDDVGDDDQRPQHDGDRNRRARRCCRRRWAITSKLVTNCTTTPPKAMLATTMGDHIKTDDKLYDDATDAHCTRTPYAQHDHTQHKHTAQANSAGPHSALAHTGAPRKPSLPVRTTLTAARPAREHITQAHIARATQRAHTHERTAQAVPSRRAQAHTAHTRRTRARGWGKAFVRPPESHVRSSGSTRESQGA